MDDSNMNHVPWRDQVDSPKSYALSGNIMLTAIIILLAVVVFLVVLHLYARWYLLRVRRQYLNRRRSRRHRATHLVFYVDPNNQTVTVPSAGLPNSVINSLPVFIYSSKTHKNQVLECAVCLSEFEENEKGRSLPKCHHNFHTDCIDMWFHSHSTCPLCRSPVEPVPDGQPDVVISVAEPGSSSGNGGEEESQTSSLVDRRKGLEMAGVTIEVPRRTEFGDEFRLDSPASQGFRSPGSRLLSLKRILSMNRKSPAVSPSSGIGTSCINETTRVPTPR